MLHAVSSAKGFGAALVQWWAVCTPIKNMFWAVKQCSIRWPFFHISWNHSCISYMGRWKCFFCTPSNRNRVSSSSFSLSGIAQYDSKSKSDSSKLYWKKLWSGSQTRAGEIRGVSKDSDRVCCKCCVCLVHSVSVDTQPNPIKMKVLFFA